MAKLTGGEVFAKRLDEISDGVTKGGSLRVGWPSSATYPDGTSVALIAAINEFGAPSRNQPPRPFMRNAINDNSPYWPEQIANLLKMTNYDTIKTLNFMGVEIVGQVQDSIDKLMEPPLAPSTIARKGFDKPLIDSGVMRKTVTYEVIEDAASPPQGGGGFFSRAVRKLKGWFGL